MTLVAKSRPSSSSSPSHSHTIPPTLEEESLEHHLSKPILLSEQIRKTTSTQSLTSKSEIFDLSKKVDHLSHMLRSLVRFTTTTTATSTPSIYEPPIRRISSDVFKTLSKAYTLVRKCRRGSNIFRRLVNLVTAADFRRIFSLLEASTADLRWLISVFRVDDLKSVNESDDVVVLSLPPIASNDPILAWVWSYTATVQMSSSLSARTEAAREIGLLARDNDRNKKMIVEEGGVPPLLRLLKEVTSSDAQITAAVALLNLCSNDGKTIRIIVEESGVPLIVQLLSNSSMRVQTKAAELVARMAEIDNDDDSDGFVKEEFGRENVINPLVSLLAFETFEYELEALKRFGSFHSVVETNNNNIKLSKPKLNSSSSLSSSLSASSPLSWSSESSKGGVKMKKEREKESDEVKMEVKISCAKAIYMLVKNSVSNSVRITETKGLLCLAKLIDKHRDVLPLQNNCVMAIMEITRVAESNADLRRSAFKTNSAAAKAVVDQLVRVITESRDQSLQLSAIRSIGFLSRTFSAKETRVIGTLVKLLNNLDHEVATEAAIALAKFADPENFLCQQHSKVIIDFGGVLPLMKLLRASDKALVHGLVLLCYLAINASKDEALEQARVLAALEGADRSLIAQHPQLKELIAKAVHHLDLYRVVTHSFRQSSLRI